MEELSTILQRIKDRPSTGLLRSSRPFTAQDCEPIIRAIGESFIPGFVLDKNNRATYETFASWVLSSPDSGLDNFKGIYLAGPIGTGKTLCMKVMRDFAREIGVMVKVDAHADFLAWKTWRTDEVCADYASTGDLSVYKETRIACFEDLGSEPMETLYMGNRTNVMREIIEYRGDRRDLITMFTSNIPIDKLSSFGQNTRYGQRVQSRIIQMCNPLVLVGADRRK